MRENPNFYAEFLQQTQQQNPAMYQAIQQNQAAFMNAVFTGNPNLGLPVGGAGPQGGMPGMPGMPGGGQRPPPNAISVNREEMEAIQRLQ